MVLLQHVFCFVTVIKALDWKGFVSMLPKIRVAFAEKIFHIEYLYLCDEAYIIRPPRWRFSHS